MTITNAASAWQQERGRLIAIAYRMLGDLGEAEDVSSEVAESALLAERRGEEIRSWPAWLTTTCVRRSVDRVRALAARRETYPGPWLPEPIALDRAPDEVAATRELLSIALLHMADQLSAHARAAVVLHRAFAMTAPEIGTILERSPGSVRQLISRAERSLRLDADAAPSRSADPAILRRLLAAIESGDVPAALELLDDDAVLWVDGGGKIRAALRPVRGADAVLRFVLGVAAKTRREGNPGKATSITVNGQPGLDIRSNVRRDVVVLDVSAHGKVAEIRQICNPDKLRRI